MGFHISSTLYCLTMGIFFFKKTILFKKDSSAVGNTATLAEDQVRCPVPAWQLITTGSSSFKTLMPFSGGRGHAHGIQEGVCKCARECGDPPLMSRGGSPG